jgi:hypothetical protein
MKHGSQTVNGFEASVVSQSENSLRRRGYPIRAGGYDERQQTPGHRCRTSHQCYIGGGRPAIYAASSSARSLNIAVNSRGAPLVLSVLIWLGVVYGLWDVYDAHARRCGHPWLAGVDAHAAYRAGRDARAAGEDAHLLKPLH